MDIINYPFVKWTIGAEVQLTPWFKYMSDTNIMTSREGWDLGNQQ